jgi:hypothetical protein
MSGFVASWHLWRSYRLRRIATRLVGVTDWLLMASHVALFKGIASGADPEAVKRAIERSRRAKDGGDGDV